MTACACLVGAAVAQSVVNKVDGPDVVRIVWPEPDDGRIVMVEALALLVPVRQRQALFAPEALNPLMIDPSAFHAEQLADLAVPVPSVPLGEPDQGKTQIIVIRLL